MQKTTIIFVTVSLIIGLGIGYVIGSKKYERPNRGEFSKNIQMTHQMPDGTTMMNSSIDGSNMDSMMESMMTGIKGKTGDDFDKAFLSEMVLHHEGAVEMAKIVLTTSKRPELIKLANEIVQAQTREINMMNNWQNSWFNIR